MTEPRKGEETPEPAERAAAGHSSAQERKATRSEQGQGADAVVRPAGPSTAVVGPRHEPGQPVVSRRGILRLGFWSGLGAIIAGAAAGGADLLYPRGVSGFGAKVSVSENEVPSPGQKTVIARGRFWLANVTEEQGGPGLLALWWKCPHLGCTVPWREKFVWPDPTTGTEKQGWFRCPCHGSTYTDAGILVYGPAPRPLDTMELVVERGRITVDTGKITQGAPDNPQRAVRI